MIIFVYGEDGFRAQEKVRVMKKKFQEKFDASGMNLAEFSDKAKVGEVAQSVQSPPFLGEKRMVVLKDLLASLTKKADYEPWLTIFESVPESTILIFYETMAPKKLEEHAVYKALASGAETHAYPFPILEGAALTRWVQERAKTSGAAFDRESVQGLVARVGSDLWQMDNEIGKLGAFASGGTVAKEMVDELVRASFEDQIFALVDAVAKRDAASTIRLLEEERLSGATDQYIFSMLARQVRILLGARSLLEERDRVTKDEVAREMSLHPFVAGKALAQARQFKMAELQTLHDMLFELDQGSKNGKVNAELAVDLIVSNMLV